MTPASPAPHGPSIAGYNLALGVHRAALAQPMRTALVVGDQRYSFQSLAGAAARVAAWLQPTLAAQAEPRVGVLAARRFETFAGILGAAWAGAAYVPLHPQQPAARLRSIVEQAGLAAVVADAGAQAVLADAGLRAALPPKVLAQRPLDGLPATAWEDLPAEGMPQPVAVAAQRPAYVMFTSGTTGRPKGVVVSCGAVAHFLAAMRGLYAISPADRVGQFCETTFDVSVFETFAAWDGGASLHVLPETALMAPAGFIRREQLTVWTSVPSVIPMLARLKQLEPGMFPTLRASFFIGEALPSSAARAWQRAAPASVVDNHYGPTEATVAFTVQRVTEPLRETPGRAIVAIGRPYDGLEAAILGDGGTFAADGERGEIVLHGPQLADGYLDDPERTAAAFPVLDHPRVGRSRWYRTGDLGVRDADGVLHFLGRVDHQVKILGHRVELEDVEAHLRAAAGCDAVAAVPWPVVDGLATGLVAFVSGAQASSAEIRERLRERLPAYMRPRRVVMLETMPRSAAGKVDRAALAATLRAGSPDTPG